MLYGINLNAVDYRGMVLQCQMSSNFRPFDLTSDSGSYSGFDQIPGVQQGCNRGSAKIRTCLHKYTKKHKIVVN